MNKLPNVLIVALMASAIFSCKKSDKNDFSKMAGTRHWLGTYVGREYVFSHRYRDFSYVIDSFITVRILNETTVEMLGSEFKFLGRGGSSQFEFTEIDSLAHSGVSFAGQARLAYYPVGDSIKYEMHYHPGGNEWKDIVMVAR